MNRKRLALFYVILFFLLLAATAAVLGVLEYAASFYAEKQVKQFLWGDQLNHIWPPNYRFTHKEWVKNNPDFPKPFTLTYNAQSWIESYDIARKKPADTYRIFYVGDSYTEGTVPMDQSLPSRLEQYLNTELPDCGRHFEVINTGTLSYSPVLYYILIRYRILAFDPDVIVVNVDMTDDYNDWTYAQKLITDDAGNPLAAPPRSSYGKDYIQTAVGVRKNSLLAKIALYLYQNSYLYNYIKNNFSFNRAAVSDTQQDTDNSASLHEQRVYTPYSWCRYEWDAFTQENVAFTLDILDRIIRLCKEHKVKILVTSVPHYEQYAVGADGKALWSALPHQVIAEQVAKSGGVYLDSFNGLAPFISGTEQGKYYYNGDMHFNPRGYAIWAPLHIKSFLDPDLGLLPETCYPDKTKPKSSLR